MRLLQHNVSGQAALLFELVQTAVRGAVAVAMLQSSCCSICQVLHMAWHSFVSLQAEIRIINPCQTVMS